MAKITEIEEVAVSLLKPYENNAKRHSKEQLEKIKASIKEFGFVSPCLVDKNFNVIAGHGRIMAAEELGMIKVPCVYIEGLTDAQRKAYILADNRLGELGTWDFEIVKDELLFLNDIDFDVKITGFDLPDKWELFENRQKFDNSRQEGNDEYNDFLDKFEQPKTTDDCYTPENIYEIIENYVETKYNKNRADFVRPFFPGGDYQAQQYKKTDVVVDNPPFSILAEIIDFYVEKEQGFFLFAPGLSTLGYTNKKNVSAVCCYVPITYENGAVVLTSFLTNLDSPDVAARTDPELHKKIIETNKKNEKALKKELPKYEFPYEVLTSAKLGYLSKYDQEWEILRNDSLFIRSLDAMKEYGKGIFGGALLLSERAAAERAAAERAAAERAAAERAAAICWELSEREKEIIKSLGSVTNEKQNDTTRASE